MNDISKYQKYEIDTINRNEIKNAEYNPRTIDDESKKKLKNNIKKHGLVSTLTWNKRTGNLVGGHQRLSQIDLLEKSEDYSLQVAVIDVDLEEEKKLNVILNNPNMQGDWNNDKLKELLDDIDYKDLGFDDVDIDIMFDGEISELYTDNNEVVATKEEIQNIKEHRQNFSEKLKNENSANFYFIIVCRNQEDKKQLYKEIGIPISEEYISSEQIRRLKSN
ncbi:MAG: ParB N-terminal domain-containing protein [Clostridia bacterium]